MSADRVSTRWRCSCGSKDLRSMPGRQGQCGCPESHEGQHGRTTNRDCRSESGDVGAAQREDRFSAGCFGPVYLQIAISSLHRLSRRPWNFPGLPAMASVFFFIACWRSSKRVTRMGQFGGNGWRTIKIHSRWLHNVVPEKRGFRRRGPAVCSSLRPREARVNDKSTRSFARPAKGNIRQGEGRHVLRFPTRKLQGLGRRRWSRNGL